MPDFRHAYENRICQPPGLIIDTECAHITLSHSPLYLEAPVRDIINMGKSLPRCISQGSTSPTSQSMRRGMPLRWITPFIFSLASLILLLSPLIGRTRTGSGTTKTHYIPTHLPASGFVTFTNHDARYELPTDLIRIGRID